MKLPKIDIGKVLGVASLVGSLVKATQEKLKGKSGADKHAVVLDQVKALLPILEGLSGEDLANDALLAKAVDTLIAAEKSVLVARANVAALIADIKAKRAA